jgi:hypothetical protein
MNAQKPQYSNYKFPPIVLTHNLPPTSFHNQRIFRELVKLLANLLEILTNIFPTLNPSPKLIEP